MEVTLQGKVVLVVGASRGLGEDTARGFAAEGASVVLAARKKTALDAIVKDLRGKKQTALAIVADATKESDVAMVAARTREAHGDPDVVVHCVGESLLRENLRDIKAAEWARAMDENSTAFFYVMREFLPRMMERQSGLIVNVTSRVGVFGVAKASVYGAAKAASIHFSETWAAEAWKSGVKIVTVAPGPMDTPMRWEATPQFDPKRTVDPKDIADLFVWMAKHPNVAFDTPLVPLSLMN
jgi:NAD(P)-dependent dehydrogenase (short-subunit alcohol dehydrogenase family)